MPNALINRSRLFTFLAAAAFTLGTVRAEEPGLLFHLDFSNGFTADSKGANAPTNTDHLPTIVDGFKGKGAQFNQGTVLRYQNEGNLNKKRGAISMWVQSPFDGVGETGKFYTYFREDGQNDIGSSVIWAWYCGGTGVRFDIRDAKDKYIFGVPSKQWKKGEWHHLVFNWDGESSTTHQLYMDGKLMSESNLQMARGPVPWVPKPYPGFFLGAQEADGTKAADGVIGDFSIYDHPLSIDEIRREYLKKETTLTRVMVAEPVLTAGQASKLPVEFDNLGGEKTDLSAIGYDLLDSTGKSVGKGTLPNQSLASGQRIMVDVKGPALPAGTYQMKIAFTEKGQAQTETQDVWVLAAKEDASAKEEKLADVTTVDATKKEPTAHIGDTQVVQSKLGDYRESGSKRHDRFAYQFEVTDIDKPHLAIITYPDDKPRTMEILLQDLGGAYDYQAQSGAYTGDEYPLTNKMVEHRIVFWPHSKQQAFIFMTEQNGHPAAIQSIKISRLDQEASVPVTGFSGTVPAREVGFYYEDPVLNQNFGTSTDFAGFAEGTNRLIDYMKSFGQTTLSYPMAWYSGPLYGTLVEAREPNREGAALGGLRPHPQGFFTYLMKRLQANGMTFNAHLSIHELPSLDPYFITDADKINQGADTVVNVRFDGTPWFGHWHDSDTNYNAGDPRVQKAVKDIVKEIVDRYGDEPAFEGITLVLPRAKLYTFASLQSGYNDSNLKAFQKDTGITIPEYKLDDPKRTSAAFKWLMSDEKAKDAWINWRCKVLHDYYKAIADIISAKRPGLKLTLSISPPGYADFPTDYEVRPGLSQLRIKEMGIDADLFKNDKNIVVGYLFVPADLRWMGSNHPEATAYAATKYHAARAAMMSEDVVDYMSALPQTEVIIHDRYWEDPVAGKNPLPNLPVKECGWRVSTINPTGVHALEPYVAALNDFDVFRITKGGFLIGTYGMEDVLLPFSRAFHALPAVKFDDIAGLSDPVRGRQKTVDGKLYFYLLNRLAQSSTVSLKLDKAMALEEPATGKKYEAKDTLSVPLAPFELRVFRGASAGTVTGSTELDPAAVAQLKQKLDDIKAQAAQLEEKKVDTAKFTKFMTFANDCWSKKEYARLFYMLQEEWTGQLQVTVDNNP